VHRLCVYDLQQSDTKKLLNDERRSKEEIVEKHNVLHFLLFFSHQANLIIFTVIKSIYHSSCGILCYANVKK